VPGRKRPEMEVSVYRQLMFVKHYVRGCSWSIMSMAPSCTELLQAPSLRQQELAAAGCAGGREEGAVREEMERGQRGRLWRALFSPKSHPGVCI